jgi:hypothetical protein
MTPPGESVWIRIGSAVSMRDPVVHPATKSTSETGDLVVAMDNGRTGEEDPKESVPRSELGALDRACQRRQLLTECKILERDCSVSATDQTDRAEE